MEVPWEQSELQVQSGARFWSAVDDFGRLLWPHRL